MEAKQPGRGGGRRRQSTNNPDRVPPQDIEAEKALLGSMCIAPAQTIEPAVSILGRNRPDRFYVPAHRRIYEALIGLNTHGAAVDIVTVRDELNRLGCLGEIGGADYLAELAEHVPNAVHVEHYARIVREKSALRELIESFGRMTEASYEGQIEAESICRQTEEAARAIAAGAVDPSQARPAADVFDDLMAEIESRGDSFVPVWPTGFSKIDAIIGGFRAGQMIVVGGRPSVGKSSCALCIAWNMANPGFTVLYITLEETKEDLLIKCICRQAELTFQQVAGAKKKDRELIEGIRAWRRTVEQSALLFADTVGQGQRAGRSLDHVLGTIRRHHREQHIKVAVIDYLNLLTIPGMEDKPRFEVVQIMSGAIKALAIELNIIIILVCQLNRAPTVGGGRKPTLSDLKESSSIEQDADMVIFVHREAYYDKTLEPDQHIKADILIEKHRQGPTGEAHMGWYARHFRLSDDVMTATEATERGWYGPNTAASYQSSYMPPPPLFDQPVSLAAKPAPVPEPIGRTAFDSMFESKEEAPCPF